jgi:hypothetical protein
LNQTRQVFSSERAAYLWVEGAAAAAAWGEEVDDDELVASVEEGVGEVLRGLDLPHVGVQTLLPPPHGLGKRQVHL